MSEQRMPSFNALYKAIMVRQDERAAAGLPPLKEMHVPAEMLARIKHEMRSICIVVDPSITENQMCGVLLLELEL